MKTETHESFEDAENRFLKGAIPNTSNEIHIKFSSVKRAKYIPEDKILELEFQGGSTYKYKNFPEEKWIALKASEKVGSFIHKEVKNNHEYEKVC